MAMSSWWHSNEWSSSLAFQCSPWHPLDSLQAVSVMGLAPPSCSIPCTSTIRTRWWCNRQRCTRAWCLHQGAHLNSLIKFLQDDTKKICLDRRLPTLGSPPIHLDRSLRLHPAHQKTLLSTCSIRWIRIRWTQWWTSTRCNSNISSYSSNSATTNCKQIVQWSPAVRRLRPVRMLYQRPRVQVETKLEVYSLRLSRSRPS